jgi:hypothetical protein
MAIHYDNHHNNGSIQSGAASIHGGMSMASSGQSYSPISPGSITESSHGGHHCQQQKRYSRTVRSNASSILSLGRQKTEPPVMMLSHYNSPYEAIYFNQPGMALYLFIEGREKGIERGSGRQVSV